MRSIMVLAVMLAASFKLLATEPIDKRITALCLISELHEYVGQGQTKIYTEDLDGHFRIIPNSQKGVVDIRYSDKKGSGKDNWGIWFSAPKEKNFKLGLYEDVKMAYFDKEKACFHIFGCGRGSNDPRAEFEVIEVIYDDEGNLESFAADFVQTNSYPKPEPSLYGSVRINSTIPLTAGYIEDVLQTAPDYDSGTFALHLDSMDKDPVGEGEKTTYIGGKDGTFSTGFVTHNDDAIQIEFKSFANPRTVWKLSISPGYNRALEMGSFENATGDITFGSFPGIRLTKNGIPSPHDKDGVGHFDILEIERDARGVIKTLAVDFVQAIDQEATPLFGCLRYNSDIPLKTDYSQEHSDYDAQTSCQTGGMFIAGAPGERITSGKTLEFNEQDGQFMLNPVFHGNRCRGIKFTFQPNGSESHEYWRVEFSPPFDQPLEPGMYKITSAYDSVDSARLAFFTDFSCYMDSVIGECEVLEIGYDALDRICAFAADFIYQDGEEPPLFGSIRYNSSIPHKKEYEKNLARYPVIEKPPVIVYDDDDEFEDDAVYDEDDWY